MGKVISVQPFDLKPGVTDADIEAHLRDSTFSVPGITVYVAKGDRGARNGQYVAIIETESAELRDRYFPADGSPSDEFTQLFAPFMAEDERFRKLTTWPNPDSTDYHVISESK